MNKIKGGYECIDETEAGTKGTKILDLSYER
jgi:hypothetical protein